jgi:hypothetical protein
LCPTHPSDHDGDSLPRQLDARIELLNRHFCQPARRTSWLLDTMQQDPTVTAEALKFFAWSYAKVHKMVDETRLCADA